MTDLTEARNGHVSGSREPTAEGLPPGSEEEHPAETPNPTAEPRRDDANKAMFTKEAMELLGRCAANHVTNINGLALQDQLRLLRKDPRPPTPR